jgi:transcription elongation factor Elf1
MSSVCKCPYCHHQIRLPKTLKAKWNDTQNYIEHCDECGKDYVVSVDIKLSFRTEVE